MNLFVDDFQGDEVVFFIEPAVVEKQSISFSGSKPAKRASLRYLANVTTKSFRDALTSHRVMFCLIGWL